ncbi:FAD-binding oxidoreductase [Roseibacterium sp. SDUM158017]|uniref:FAD-binding oxidoreductase n=1 Tax=Roseicyclus salinarum TaxID=3036773 RepID=UPI002414D563|nr:FAD-binding oxidoreductase [Roseibacterium sp. SDUM158017]MDG4650557.1 FAD-binding oxidoreductase [Roseibacterium sp. SDUM158017]
MTRLSGWGRTPVAECRQRTARNQADVARAVAEGPLIARGNGRSYGDPAMSPGLTLSMRGMDRFLSFDADSGTLVAEAGVLLADIIDTFLPRGWFPLVTPGTKFVSLGGAIAADVHGKNHHRDGSFRTCVNWIDAMGADGEVRRISRGDNAQDFEAVCGAMGLSGVILRAEIRLRPVESAWIMQETIPAPTLEAAIDTFEERLDALYSVAWIDCTSRPPGLGRSLVMLGRHATVDELPRDRRRKPFEVPGRRGLKVPIDFPGFALNRYSVHLFNELYYRMGRRKAGETLVDWDSYFYPLDAIGDWNRIYGRRGFYQFQCVLPLDGARAGLTRMLDDISRTGLSSFLSVLKRFGADESRLSFPSEGYTLALDFPANDRSRALLERLDAIALDHGGRFYLAKDARMSAETAISADPRLAEFRDLRRDRGWSERFVSLQSERLGL